MNRKHNRLVLDPADPEEAVRQLGLFYDIDAETLAVLPDIVQLYPRPVLMYVDEANAPFYNQTPLVDKFTFNMQTDELILFSRDPMTFIDAMVEMAMYEAGFTTMLGVDDQWKIEFTIGAWKPVKNRIKRRLDVPVLDEPLWMVGLPPSPEDAPLEDPHPFRTLVSHFDIASFTQMVRLAARDDVEVHFPVGTDPRVIEVYIRAKTAIDQVADGILLDGWREFNRRLLLMVQELEEEYRPDALPIPVWWKRAMDEGDVVDEAGAFGRSADSSPAALAGDEPDDACSDEAGARPSRTRWDPFAAYLEELLGDEE